MKKTILITGATDGIGLETAKVLAEQGNHLLLHGRNAGKLAAVTDELSAITEVDGFLADLSDLVEVEQLAESIKEKHQQLDVLINNAGIFKTPHPITDDGLDIRFVVNTLAPVLLTRRLMPIFNRSSRVVNLSSAAQATVDLDALIGRARLDDMPAYAQSKLALTIWSRTTGLARKGDEPVMIAVNPGSLLASKMVKEGFGVPGSDLRIGADILVRAALSDEFASASGQYFDNDAGRFASPHTDALNQQTSTAVMNSIEQILTKLTGK